MALGLKHSIYSTKEKCNGIVREIVYFTEYTPVKHSTVDKKGFSQPHLVMPYAAWNPYTMGG